MALRQYIGARYVPLICGDWDNTKEYEPLSIVQSVTGDSYTSKTFVPAGIDILNTDYWVCTGNYNVQVALYKETVDGYLETLADVVDVNNMLLKRTVAYQNTHINVYLNQTSGDDNNTGLTSDDPVKTFDKAVEVGNNNGSYDLRIIIQDTANYTWNAVTFSGVLHLVGNNAKLIVPNNLAFYNAHLNWENLVVDAQHADGFYADNSFVLFNNVNFGSGKFSSFASHMELNNFTAGRLRLTRSLVYTSYLTLNGVTDQPDMLSLAQCSGMVTSQLVINDPEYENITEPLYFIGCNLHFNCGLTKNGAFSHATRIAHINNSHLTMTGSRAASYRPFYVENGGMIVNQFNELCNNIGETVTINNVVTNAYVTTLNGQTYLRCFMYMPRLYFNDVTVSVANIHGYHDGNSYSFADTTATEVDHSGASFRLNIPFDNTTPQLSDAQDLCIRFNIVFTVSS